MKSQATPALLTLPTILLVAGTQMATAAITVTTSKLASGSPPTISSTDLAQTQFSTTTHAGLFNGARGNTDSDAADSGEVSLNGGSDVTITFDISVNTLGYDITNIFSVAGWDTAAGGRSNQGYGIRLTFMNDTTADLMARTHWEPNSATAGYWTTVNFSSGGGTLNEGSVTATGVKSITFFNTFSSIATPGTNVIYREFDIQGVATTIPEPSAALLGSMGFLLLLRRRRQGPALVLHR